MFELSVYILNITYKPYDTSTFILSVSDKAANLEKANKH